MEKDEYSVGVLDYVIIGASLLLSVGIGFCSNYSSKVEASKDKVSAYLLGNRSMAMIPVAFSIMATVMSGNAIAGHIGEIYLYGVSSFIAIIGAMIAKVFAGLWIVPVFHNMPYTSIYEYLERRYDRTMRTLFSGTYMACNTIYLGTVLYAPAISITTLTGIPYWATSGVIGIICTLYCILGGMKAVVWTDLCQALLMFISVILLMIISVLAAGGFTNVFEAASAPGVQHFHLLEAATIRYSVWSLFCNGFVATIKGSVIGQTGAQRILSVKNTSVAQQSIFFSAFLMILFKVFVVLAALAIYACFANCDPLQRQKETGIHSADQIFIYAVARQMSSYPGLQGLALAGLLSASLSTCSSFINSFATMTLEDFIKPFRPQWAKSETRSILICKILTTVYGGIAILTSLGIPYMGGIVKVNMGIAWALLGPLGGTMLTAIFWWKANAKSSKVALFFGVLLTVWLVVGSSFYSVKATTLPLSTDGCDLNHGTLGNFTSGGFNFSTSSPKPWTERNATTDDLLELRNATQVAKQQDNYYMFLFPLSAVSFMWFGTIGMSVTIVLTVCLSFIGVSDYPDPRLLSPIAAKYMLRSQDSKDCKKHVQGSNATIVTTDASVTRF